METAVRRPEAVIHLQPGESDQKVLLSNNTLYESLSHRQLIVPFKESKLPHRVACA